MPKCQRWTWAAKLDPSQLNETHLFAAYNLNFDNLCKLDSCRRNCKRVLCIACFDKSWIDSDQSNDSIDLTDDSSQKRSDVKSFVGLKNLGATCYVNCLLQLWFHNPALRKAIYLWRSKSFDDEQNKQQQQQQQPLQITYGKRAELTTTPQEHNKVFDDGNKSDVEFSQTDKASTRSSKRHDEDANKNSPSSSLGAKSHLQSNPIQQLQLIFARLQFTNKKSIDPFNFIQSLALNATEQQDAQEFGNLFMEFLEKSFSDQASQFVSRVIQNQFCGRYSYATICDSCKHSSLNDSKFYELDLSIQKMETLNDCLDEFFRPVPLDGKYNCSNCQKASSAHRKIILKSLPPTLNLQLLRFIYDVQRSVRQKLNSYLTFPEVLDMSPYLNSNSTLNSQARLKPSTNGFNQSHIYTLTAVLIHRGSSPHSGHYIAHIKDRISKDWYKFNDDSVERIGPELHVPTDGESVTVVDTETKIAIKVEDKFKLKLPLKSNNLKSKTAYMLVYQAQDNEALTYPTDHSDEWDLPEHLATAVVEENSESDELFESRKIAREFDRKMIEERKRQIRFIYDKLTCTSPSDSFEFIDKKWLQDWLTNSSTDANFPPICNKKFLCIHNKLDFRKIDQVKCVTTDGADLLYKEFGGGPRLQGALCRDCVEVEVRHYQLRERMKEDQKFITSQAKFKISADTPFEECFCVGKDSYRDWQRLVIHQFEQKYPEIRKPKKTQANNSEDENKNDPNKPPLKVVTIDEDDNSSSDEDDSLDNFQFNSDLLCEHNCLTQELTNWRIVPKEVWEIFKRYFNNDNDAESDLIEFTAADSLCEECKSQESKRLEIGDVKKQAAAVIKHKLYDLFHLKKRASWCTMLPGDVYYALDKQFLTKWQKFIRNPCNQEQPEMITNRERLLCSHGRSLYFCKNSNLEQAECPFILVTPDEWKTLKECYAHDAELSFVVDIDMVEAKKLVLLKQKENEMPLQQLNHCNNEKVNLNGNGKVQQQNYNHDQSSNMNDESELPDLDWSDCIRSDPEYCSKCYEILEEDELKKKLNYESTTIYITKVESSSVFKPQNSIGLTNGSAFVYETNHCDKSMALSSQTIQYDPQYKGDTLDPDDDGVIGAKRRKKMDIEDEANDFIPPGAKQISSSPSPSNSMLRRTTRRNRNREQAYTIKPTQTLLELKKEIFTRCQVLPMDQRLFLNDLLLDDNSKTMFELKITPNSSLRLEVDKPLTDTIDLIEDEPLKRKSCTQPETGFKGSLLLSNSHL